MKHYLLFYEIADDYLERRATLRDQHLEQAWAASANWSVRQWSTVAGAGAANPVRPATKSGPSR